MDENLFRIVVALGVVIASTAFVVQAFIMLALYKTALKTRQSTERFTGKLDAAFEQVGPVIKKAEAVVDTAKPIIEMTRAVIERVGPAVDAAMPVIRKAGPVMEEARAAVAKAGLFIERATDTVASANLMINDVRPQVKEISQEAVAIVHSGREQVERIGDLVHSAGDKAKARLDQIDQSVDSTIEQVGNVGGVVKRAVMKPVREVNGIAAGISAAVSTLMRHKKSSVDAATQDEEMFI